MLSLHEAWIRRFHSKYYCFSKGKSLNKTQFPFLISANILKWTYILFLSYMKLVEMKNVSDPWKLLLNSSNKHWYTNTKVLVEVPCMSWIPLDHKLIKSRLLTASHSSPDIYNNRTRTSKWNEDSEESRTRCLVKLYLRWCYFTAQWSLRLLILKMLGSSGSVVNFQQLPYRCNQRYDAQPAEVRN